MHTGKWVYTQQTASGRYGTGALSPGNYEARFYADGGYGQLVDRVQFRIVQAFAREGRYLRVQLEGNRVIVTWSNAPTGNGSEWVSVVPAGTADGVHTGTWVYTQRATSGRYDVGSLGPGDYEARFYADGGYGQIVDRVPFTL